MAAAAKSPVAAAPQAGAHAAAVAAAAAKPRGPTGTLVVNKAAAARISNAAPIPPPKSPGAPLKFKEGDPTVIFSLLARLGKGAFGAVYKAMDSRDQKIVAIKVVEFDAKEEENLARETRILDDCHHPNIVGYRGCWKNGDEIWIVMECCVTSLSDLMEHAETAVPEPMIAATMKMCLQALHYLHTHTKTIHRDIKAGNVLITVDGVCKLADFGVSAELVQSYAITYTGTPFWMAPEVLMNNKYSFQADIWSLGITAIELAQRNPPLFNMHYLKAALLIPKNPPPKLDDESKFSNDFKSFLSLALTKKPEDRPTAERMLKHPFILHASDEKALAAWLHSLQPRVEAWKKAKDAHDREVEANRKRREDEANGHGHHGRPRTEAEKEVDGDGDGDGDEARRDSSSFVKEGQATVQSRIGTTGSNNDSVRGNSGTDTVVGDNQFEDESDRFASHDAKKHNNPQPPKPAQPPNPSSAAALMKPTATAAAPTPAPAATAAAKAGAPAAAAKPTVPAATAAAKPAAPTATAAAKSAVPAATTAKPSAPAPAAKPPAAVAKK